MTKYICETSITKQRQTVIRTIIKLKEMTKYICETNITKPRQTVIRVNDKIIIKLTRMTKCVFGQRR